MEKVWAKARRVGVGSGVRRLGVSRNNLAPKWCKSGLCNKLR